MKMTRNWPWLLALICAVITMVTALNAFQAVRAEPEHELSIRVVGEHDWNISQETVDALLSEPIRSWRPLEMTFTDRWLTGDELLRGQVPENSIIVSAQLQRLRTEEPVAERFTGAGFDRNLSSAEKYTDIRFDISQGFLDNLGLGHGPAAVVAAAEQAAALLGGGPVTNPVYWLAGIGLGAMTTAAFLGVGMRRRGVRIKREQRLKAAGRKLARVVLDLEALEVTYRTVRETDRPAGFTRSWEKLERLSLDAARREQRLLPDEAEYAQELSAFEREVRELTELADGLLGAGSVHAQLAGTGSTFDRLSQPINAATLELLNRLQAAPGRMVSQQQLDAIRAGLDRLISVANSADDSRQAIDQWSAAEAELAETVRKFNAWLRRYPHDRSPITPIQEAAALRTLRQSLGLAESAALTQLGRANARVRSILGDLPTDTPQTSAHGRRGRQNRAKKRGDEPPARRRWLQAGVALGILLVAMIVSGVLVAPYSQRPQAEENSGSAALELVIDGTHEQVVEADIRRFMDMEFPQPERITIAVRDAAAYLQYDPEEPDRLIPRNIPDILWRLKDEFGEKVDELTGELREGETIIPAMIFADGTLAIPGMASWQVSGGDYGWGMNWEHGSIRGSDYGDITLANMIDDYAEALVRNDARRPDFSVSGLFWTLSFTLWLTVLNALVLLRFALSATQRLGQLGRGGRRLRTVQLELQKLAIGLDESRLNAVAVLGAGPPGTAAEAGQRLHERALAMAWRESEELSAIELSARFGADFERRVAHLEGLVRTLQRHEVDVQVRADEFIAATRGAGG